MKNIIAKDAAASRTNERMPIMRGGSMPNGGKGKP
jgi:hypothetical protein